MAMKALCSDLSTISSVSGHFAESHFAEAISPKGCFTEGFAKGPFHRRDISPKPISPKTFCRMSISPKPVSPKLKKKRFQVTEKSDKSKVAKRSSNESDSECNK
uniref:Uncharacterized protein n=1 Tax=Rhizophagus irregularis (strain DAOM 181602 / DAOM 197198 / MUCL 43194) TaxID=747089 RepID=U9UEQ3_RHIID